MLSRERVLELARQAGFGLKFTEDEFLNEDRDIRLDLTPIVVEFARLIQVEVTQGN